MAKHQNVKSSLTELGITADADPAQALDKLRSLRASGGANDARIAAAAAELASPESLGLLAEMEAGATGELRREIRRARFRLRQLGVTAGPDVATAPAASQPGAPASGPGRGSENSSLGALLSPVDPEGVRLVWLWHSRPQGGLTRLWGLTSEKEGLVGANVVQVSRRQFKTERQELERRAATRLIEVDWRLGDYILCEAYRQTPEARRTLVGNFYTLRAEILAAPPATEFHHPLYEQFGQPSDQEPSPELLKEPEIGRWEFDAAEIKPYVDEIAEVQQSPLVLNRYQQEERINAIVGRAVDAFFGGARGIIARRRLEDNGYYLARTGREQAARWAAASAARLGAGEDPKHLALLRQLVMTRFGVVMGEAQQQAAQEPRLIMTPAEAMAARSRRPPR